MIQVVQVGTHHPRVGVHDAVNVMHVFGVETLRCHTGDEGLQFRGLARGRLANEQRQL